MGHSGSGLEDALGGGHALAAQGLRGLQGSSQCFQLVRRQVASDQNILRLRGAAADGLSHQAEHLSVRAAIGAALHLIEPCIQLSGFLGAVAGQRAQHGQAGGAVQLAGRVDHAVQQELDHDHAAGKHTAQQCTQYHHLCHRASCLFRLFRQFHSFQSLLFIFNALFQNAVSSLQRGNLILQIRQIIPILLLIITQPSHYRYRTGSSQLCNAVGANGALDGGPNILHPHQQCVQNLICRSLIRTISTNCQQSSGRITTHTHQFPQIAFLHAHSFCDFVHGLAVRDQGRICLQHCIGIVHILIIHSRHDLVIRRDIQICLCHRHIIGINRVQNRIIQVFLGILDLDLRTLNDLLIFQQFFLVFLNICVVFCLFLTVGKHFLVIFLLSSTLCHGNVLAVRSLACRITGISVLCQTKACCQHRTDHYSHKNLTILMQNRKCKLNQVDLFLVIIRCLVFVHALLLRTKPIFMFVPFCAMHIL